MVEYFVSRNVVCPPSGDIGWNLRLRMGKGSDEEEVSMRVM